MYVRLYFNHLDICFASLFSGTSGENDFVDPIGHEHVAGVSCGWGDYKIPWGYNPLNKSAEWLACFSRYETVEM